MPEIVPAAVLGKSHGHKAPSDKMNILGVGIGGRGASDLAAMETENIIGLCDVDWNYAEHVFKNILRQNAITTGVRCMTRCSKMLTA